MTQDEKHFLNLAGEFLVAGELSRRHISCSVTYGNSKQADVLIFSESGRVLRVEVKATSRQAFIVGNKALDEKFVSPETFWVLVYLPDGGGAPKYFIFSSIEMHRRAHDKFVIYDEQYFQKHGEHFTKPGVHKLGIKEVADLENRWDLLK